MSLFQRIPLFSLIFLIFFMCCLNARADDGILLYTYFRDNGESGTCLAYSEDGFDFKPLNQDRPLLRPGKWPGQTLTRDTSMIYHNGLFHAVWTTNWAGPVFGYAESSDLVHWTAPVKVDVFKPDSYIPDTTWAPEIHWDSIKNNYLITVASKGIVKPSSKLATQFSAFRGSNQSNYNIYVTRTKDGINFTEAALFFAIPFNVIDAQMVFSGNGQGVSAYRWIMVYKIEDAQGAGGKNLRYSTAPADFSRPWSTPSPALVGPGSTVRPKEEAEGPCLIWWKNQWLLYWDAFNNGHYSVASSSDLEHWRDRTSELKTPPHPRHGTVFQISSTAFQIVQKAIGDRATMLTVKPTQPN